MTVVQTCRPRYISEHVSDAMVSAPRLIIALAASLAPMLSDPNRFTCITEAPDGLFIELNFSYRTRVPAAIPR